MTGSVAEDTRSLLRRTLRGAERSEMDALSALDALFDEPARIAIAGMVKAGKSTLLNALVGERVAPTDAGECTRIPTWYRRGRHYEVRAVDRSGESGQALTFERGEDLTVDLAGRDPQTVDHLLVECPTSRLAQHTLIDLPGHSSLSPDVSRRAAGFLTPDEGVPVDAVIYLLRYRSPADLDFLEAFHSGVGGRGAMGALSVLSRADELSGARLDAMDTARRVADSLRDEPRLQGLCQDVIPVAGLLAETSASLRAAEHGALRGIATLPADDIEFALSSVDRFRSAHLDGPPVAEREALLDRLGLFGVRVGVDILRRQPDRTADSLASDLAEMSGIGLLRRALDQRFLQRLPDLRARVVLRRLAQSASLNADPDSVRELERITANAHELRELEIVDLLRRVPLPGLSPDDSVTAQRVLGGSGVGTRERLGAPPESATGELRPMAIEQHRRWAMVAESPLVEPSTVYVATSVARTCEAMLVGELAGG